VSQLNVIMQKLTSPKMQLVTW